jgi:hypothetical protein
VANICGDNKNGSRDGIGKKYRSCHGKEISKSVIKGENYGIRGKRQIFPPPFNELSQ